MLDTFHSRFFSHMAEQLNLKYYFKLSRNKYQCMLVHFWKTPLNRKTWNLFNPFRLARVKFMTSDVMESIWGSFKIVPRRTDHSVPCSLLSFRQVSIEMEWRLHLGFLERNVSLCSILNSTPMMSPTSKYMLSNVKRCHKKSRDVTHRNISKNKPSWAMSNWSIWFVWATFPRFSILISSVDDFDPINFTIISSLVPLNIKSVKI